MTLHTWLAFCATEAALCVAPGPAVLLVVSQSLSAGSRAGLTASLGILATNAAYFAVSATGVGALLLASRGAFTLVRWLGAAYLIWMGGRMLVATKAARAQGAPATSPASGSERSAFSLALVTQGTNPKALVFFTAILPQFIDPAAAVIPQILILGISSVVIEFVVLSAYVATCHSARSWIGQARVAGPLERLAGAFLIAAGARLGLQRF